MSSSLARMERRASRSREEKRGSGLLQSSLSRAVASMATDFASGVIRKLDVTDLLSNDGFDEALIAATPRILETHSPASFQNFVGALSSLGQKGFDMPGFVKRLTDEACHVQYGGTLADGSPAEIVVDLFVMPLVGWLADIEDFIETEDGLGKIARSFRPCGLSGRGSSIVIAPHLVDGETAAGILPGLARILTELLQRSLGDSDFPLDDSLKVIFAHDEQDTRPAGDVIAHRLMLGIRAQIVRRGETFVEDIFSARHDTPADHGMDVWRQEIAGLLPQRVQLGAPQRLTRGRSALALEVVTGHLISEALGTGIQLGEAFDQVNVAEGAGEILVSAVIGDRTLGPVKLSTMLAFSDAEWFAEKIVGLSKHTIAKKPGTTEKTILQ